MKKTLPFLLLILVSVIQLLAQGYQPSDKVQDFKLLNTIDKKEVALQEYQSSKGVIVVFTCNHCPFSKMYEQRIIDLHIKYAKQGYPVIAISSNDAKAVPDDSPENMAKLAKQKKYPFVYLYDESQEVAKRFGALRTPHVFLLKQAEQKFTVAYIGAIDDNAQDAGAVKDKFLENAIEELKANKEVSLKTVKAIGCTIKWIEH